MDSFTETTNQNYIHVISRILTRGVGNGVALATISENMWKKIKLQCFAIVVQKGAFCHFTRFSRDRDEAEKTN